MKIGIISSCEGCAWAGSEENWAWLADAALAAGHQVMLGADWQIARSERTAALQQRGLLVTERRRWRPVRLYLWKQKWLPDLRRLAAFQPDVLFLNAGSPLDYCHLPDLALFCARFSVPKIFGLTFNSEELVFEPRRALEDFFRRLAGVVCVSEHNLKLLHRQLPDVSLESCVARNISRLVLPTPLPMPDRNAGVRFACVARLECRWKGHDVLLAVLARPEWRSRLWTLRLYGTGPDERHIRQLVQQHGLEARVEFCGWVPDVETMWRDNHALVLASRGEGLPLVLLEAMMCGRPSIVTAVGGNAEVLTRGRTGFLADTPDEAAFARALEEAWGAQARWPEIGVAAHAVAREITARHPGETALRFARRFAPS